MPLAPVLSVQRYLSGSGHEWGGLHTEITNSHASESLRLLYLDMIPWFFRVFVHTLRVENGEAIEGWQVEKAWELLLGSVVIAARAHFRACALSIPLPFASFTCYTYVCITFSPLLLSIGSLWYNVIDVST